MSERWKEPLKLKDNNWVEWKAEVRGRLYFEKAHKAIVKPVTKEGETTKTASALQKEAEDDECARVIIEMSLSEEYLRKTEHCQSAWELWELLVNHFEAQSRNSIPTNVERLAMLVREPVEPENLVLELRGIAAKLSDTKVNSDSFLVPLAATMLPAEFNDLRTAIHTKKELTLVDADNIIKLEAKRKATKQTIAAHKPKPEKSRKFCTYCNKKGHLTEECWKKKADAADETSKSTAKAKDKTRVTMIKRKACRLYAIKEGQSEGVPWYLDSGCEGHSAKEETGFIEMCTNKTAVLESAFGQEVQVRGIGTYEVRTRPDMKLHLRDCYYSPELIANFMSASKLNKHGMDILLRRDRTVLVMDDEGVVAKGYEEKGMYRMCIGSDIDRLPKSKMAALRPNQRSNFDWHRALGHLNFDDVARLGDRLPLNRNTGPFECKTCLVGKSTRLPFKRNTIKTTKPLELIHTDLSRIIRVPSVNGAQYFVTFIDDYSRYTTVFLLKSKDQVYDAFEEYKNSVENKFSSKIKAIRSDNGTEYINSRFEKLLKESGIEQTHTHVDTPEQNGVAERMNRTLKNVARCALIDSGLPLKFWPFAIKYAVQVRNVAPNASIQHEIPHQRWHGREPKFNVFHPFGCHAIVHKLKPTNVFVENQLENQRDSNDSTVPNRDEAEATAQETENENIVHLTERQLAEYMEQNPDAQLQALPSRPRLISSGRGKRVRAKAYKVAYVSQSKEISEKLESPEGHEYKNAMDEEYNSLIGKGT